jgi:hypothetical protein
MLTQYDIIAMKGVCYGSDQNRKIHCRAKTECKTYSGAAGREIERYESRRIEMGNGQIITRLIDNATAL